jgi:hypothetical protein
MAERVAHVWCEDRGHVSVITALVRRVALELGIDGLRVETKNGAGGASRAIAELKLWQRAVHKGALGGVPDLLILVVDANSHGFAARRAELQKAVAPGMFPHVVIGCPDPHIEAWLLVDEGAFESVAGKRPVARRPRPGEDHKALFHASVTSSGVPVLTGPMELAPDIVAAMSLERSAKEDRALGAFLDELRGVLRQLR